MRLTFLARVCPLEAPTSSGRGNVTVTLEDFEDETVVFRVWAEEEEEEGEEEGGGEGRGSSLITRATRTEGGWGRRTGDRGEGAL